MSVQRNTHHQTYYKHKGFVLQILHQVTQRSITTNIIQQHHTTTRTHGRKHISVGHVQRVQRGAGSDTVPQILHARGIVVEGAGGVVAATPSTTAGTCAVVQ